MTAGYSGTPLARKLGIKPNQEIVALEAPENYEQLLDPIPEGASLRRELPPGTHGFIHFFTADRGELERIFGALKAGLEKTGILWISWPKKSSGVATDLNREIVREVGLGHGLVDTKVCAVDETWSGLKFLYRLKDR